MTQTNAFDERICEKEKCPAYFYDDAHGALCNAKLSYTGRVKAVGGKAQYGELCRLPVDFQIIRNED